jgi:hypothetical protein
MLLASLIEDVPVAMQPFAERYNNPGLPGSVASLLEAASHDSQVRLAHCQAITAAGLVQLCGAQQRRIEALEEKVDLLMREVGAETWAKNKKAPTNPREKGRKGAKQTTSDPV